MGLKVNSNTKFSEKIHLQRLKRGMRGMRDMLRGQKHSHLLGESGDHGNGSDEDHEVERLVCHLLACERFGKSEKGNVIVLHLHS